MFWKDTTRCFRNLWYTSSCLVLATGIGAILSLTAPCVWGLCGIHLAALEPVLCQHYVQDSVVSVVLPLVLYSALCPGLCVVSMVLPLVLYSTLCSGLCVLLLSVVLPLMPYSALRSGRCVVSSEDVHYTTVDGHTHALFHDRLCGCSSPYSAFPMFVVILWCPSYFRRCHALPALCLKILCHLFCCAD